MFRAEDLARNDYRATMESNLLLTSRMAYDANGNPEYLGLAAPGTATDASGWMIRQLSYDASQRPAAIRYAGGTVNFDKVWDDRASYSFQ